MGGRVVNKIHNKLAAVISNKDEVDKMGSKMTEAKVANIQVISEDFFLVAEQQTTNAFEYIAKHNLAEWGGNVSEIMFLKRYMPKIHTKCINF